MRPQLRQPVHALRLADEPVLNENITEVISRLRLLSQLGAESFTGIVAHSTVDSYLSAGVR